jgi:CHASE3 domain sensor protein
VTERALLVAPPIGAQTLPFQRATVFDAALPALRNDPAAAMSPFARAVIAKMRAQKSEPGASGDQVEAFQRHGRPDVAVAANLPSRGTKGCCPFV